MAEERQEVVIFTAEVICNVVFFAVKVKIMERGKSFAIWHRTLFQKELKGFLCFPFSGNTRHPDQQAYH